MRTLLLILVLLFLVGAFPPLGLHPYGMAVYQPLGVVLILLLILVLLGYI